MEVHRCCCAWRRDIFHNCIAAIHLCSVNPNAQLFSGDCLKPSDGVMGLTIGVLCSSAWSDPNSVPNLWGSFIRISPSWSEIFVFLLRIETLQLASVFLHAELSFLVRKGGFGQAYAVKRREIVIRGIEHKRVQLAAANADIAASEKRQRHSVLKQTGERQFVAITVDAYNLHEIGNDPHRCFRSEHLGVDSELECAWATRIERAACMPAQHPRSLDRRLRIGQRVADCLMLDDLLDASTPIALREGKSKLKSSAHQRYTEDTDESAATRK